MNDLDHLEIKRALDNLNARMTIINMLIVDFNRAVKNVVESMENLKRAIESDKNINSDEKQENKKENRNEP